MTELASVALADAGWRFLCEKAGVFVLLVDAARTIRFANAHARTVTGLPLEGGPLEQILLGFPEDHPRPWLATAPDETRLVNVRTAGGLPETLYATLVPLGEDLLFFGQADAGEQARLRREVLVLNHELGNLSRELAQSNADLAETSEQKTQFLGMATHDLRKPAGLVQLCAELLTEELGGGLSPDQQRLLDTIRSAADRMRRVIDDFLDVAMIEAGRLNLELQTIGAEELIEHPAAAGQGLGRPQERARRERPGSFGPETARRRPEDRAGLHQPAQQRHRARPRRFDGAGRRPGRGRGSPLLGHRCGPGHSGAAAGRVVRRILRDRREKD